MKKGAENTKIDLPYYFDKLAKDFSIQLTPIGNNNSLFVDEIVKGSFNVYGNAGRFYWHVYANRDTSPMNVDPYKKEVNVKGDGPYQYI